MKTQIYNNHLSNVSNKAKDFSDKIWYNFFGDNMNYDTIKSTSDGLTLSIAYSLPKGKSKGIIQFSHGMAEHKERYYPLMRYLSDNGYICIIHDHRGHGKSIKSNNDLGYFYTKNINYIIDDLYNVTCYAKNKFNNSNVYLFSHSMGTLVARGYIQKYDNQINKLILCGAPTKNSLDIIGLSLAYISSIFNNHKKDNFLDYLTFNSFNKNYNYKNAWLSKNKDNVINYNNDNLCGFTFTTNGFINLYKLQINAFKKRLYNCKNKDLNIFMIAGENDPVIGNINLFNDLKQFLLNIGYKNIESKLYKDLRHEIINEKNNKLIYQDILNFIQT